MSREGSAAPPCTAPAHRHRTGTAPAPRPGGAPEQPAPPRTPAPHHEQPQQGHRAHQQRRHRRGGGGRRAGAGRWSGGELGAVPALGHRSGWRTGLGLGRDGGGELGGATGPGTERRGWSATVSGDGGWSAASSRNRGWGTGDGAERYRGRRRRHQGVGETGKGRSASFECQGWTPGSSGSRNPDAGAAAGWEAGARLWGPEHGGVGELLLESLGRPGEGLGPGRASPLLSPVSL